MQSHNRIGRIGAFVVAAALAVGVSVGAPTALAAGAGSGDRQNGVNTPASTPTPAPRPFENIHPRQESPSISASIALGVSADGAAVVGRIGSEAFVWTRAGALRRLPGFAEGSATHSAAHAISDDGRVVVGLSSRGHLGDLQSRAFKWTHPGSMETLQGPDGGFSEAHGVNRNGSVAVGTSHSAAGGRAVRWTASGIEDPGELGTSTTPHSSALDITPDGRMIVGQSNGAAFRWARGTMESLGMLSGTVGSSVAYDASDDGSIVVGESATSNINTGMRAFRWERGRMESLGRLSGTTSSQTRGIGGDGRVIVGGSYNHRTSDERPFVWTRDSGMASPVSLEGTHDGRGVTHGVNYDGTVVVGESALGRWKRAFRWRSSAPGRATGGTMEDLGSLADHDQISGPRGNSRAHAVNRDGTAVVGQSTDQHDRTRAFRWTQARGTMHALPELAGSIFSRAVGVSDDGDIVVGYSTVPRPRPGSRERLFVFRASAAR